MDSTFSFQQGLGPNLPGGYAPYPAIPFHNMTEVSNVIRGLRQMEPKDDIAKEEIRKLIVYLTNNRQRVHYKSDRKGGYPIGSGGIESANKFICHTHMKRSGAWWVEETGNEMLRIRCAIYNGTYDKVFERYKQASLPRTTNFF